MNNISSISDYERIATINEDPNSNIGVFVATLKHSSKANEYFIVNSFKHCKKHQETFKQFFQLFNKKNSLGDMHNFLTESDKFFVLFKYEGHTSITDTFSSEKNTLNYNQRCTHLNAILMKLSQLDVLPSPAFACVSSMENISLDENLNAYIRYNFEKYESYCDKDEEAIQASIYNNIGDIIELILTEELTPPTIPINALYVKPLQIVVQKCRKCIYKSIPELIVDLKKAEKLCDKTDTASAIKQEIDKKKRAWKKYLQGAAALSVIALVIIILKPILINTTNLPNSKVGNIGSTAYNQSSTISNLLSVGNAVPMPSSPIDFSVISIPANADIPYDEYIVQYGDTIKSICTAKYNNENLVNAVKSFNNIDNPDNLIIGSIIKLPASSVIESFVSAVTSSQAASASSNSSSVSPSNSSAPSNSNADITFH